MRHVSQTKSTEAYGRKNSKKKLLLHVDPFGNVRIWVLRNGIEDVL